MEQNQDKSLFDMNMDSTAQNHILSISKWTKFISVTGFIFGGLIVLLLVMVGTEIINQLSAYSPLGTGNGTTALIILFVVVLLVAGFWIYFLFRASNMLKRGLQNRNAAEIGEGFKALKTYFTFSIVFSTLGIISTLYTLI
jgi:hypothetical protein